MVSAHGADPTFGGAERYVRELVSGMSARGHEVRVLSAFPQRGDPGVETHVLHLKDWRDDTVRRLRNHVGDIASAPWSRLAALIEEFRAELVHTNNLPGIGTGIWEVARRARIPVVHTFHDHYLLCPRTTLVRRDGSPCTPHRLLCGARTRRLARWCQAVRALLGPSEYILGMHRGLFPPIPEHIVPPPLRPLRGSPATPVRTPPRTLGYMGMLTPVKGIRLLLAAAPALAAQGFRVRVAGDGPLRREVEAAEHIRYEGWLHGESLASFMDACDIGLVPSVYNDVGPFVISDWLSGGRPVLATNRGGLIEAERRGGVMMFGESPGALLQAALRLRDVDRWPELVATLPTVDGHADVERWLDEHEAAYVAAVGPASRRAA